MAHRGARGFRPSGSSSKTRPKTRAVEIGELLGLMLPVTTISLRRALVRLGLREDATPDEVRRVLAAPARGVG